MAIDKLSIPTKKNQYPIMPINTISIFIPAILPKPSPIPKNSVLQLLIQERNQPTNTINSRHVFNFRYLLHYTFLKASLRNFLQYSIILKQLCNIVSAPLKNQASSGFDPLYQLDTVINTDLSSLSSISNFEKDLIRSKYHLVICDFLCKISRSPCGLLSLMKAICTFS